MHDDGEGSSLATGAPRVGRAPIKVGPFEVGQVVGQVYAITRVLGEGGMAVVYEAHDLALLRYVAIKVLLAPIHAHELRAEAQALASIRSPAVVTVHHITHHEGIELLVMERLVGETLEERLAAVRARGQRLTLDEVLDLLIAITDALSALHAAGGAQRDLKPGNVVLCGERVVLIDLGLFVPEVLVAAETLVSGSAAYIAPEVIQRTVQRGKGALIDLYSLGILAYEVLTNTAPFVTDTIQSMVVSHVHAPIPDVRELRPEVPGDLAELVSELMAKAPEVRPPSAEAVLWRLKHIRTMGTRRAKHMTVLVIDDDHQLGLLLKRTLESTFPQVHVETMTDPVAAMRSAHASPSDIVLVDLNMPVCNGIEVCMDLMGIPKARRPVIVGMSAEATQADIEALRALGVRHFVPKDYSFLAEMTTVIRSLRMGSRPPP